MPSVMTDKVNLNPTSTKSSSSGIQNRYSFYEAEDYATSTSTTTTTGDSKDATQQQQEEEEDVVAPMENGTEKDKKDEETSTITPIIPKSESGCTDSVMSSTSGIEASRNEMACHSFGSLTGVGRRDDDASGRDDTIPSLHVREKASTGGVATSLSTANNPIERKFPGVSSLDIGTEFCEEEEEEEEEKGHAQIQNRDGAIGYGAPDNFETKIKEALNLVRARGHKRESLLRAGLLMEPTTKEQASSTAPAVSNGNSMAPLPLYPSANKPLVPATNLDDKLLSPAVDVKETVAGSAGELFRLHENETGTEQNNNGEGNHIVDNNETQLNEEQGTDGALNTSFKGLALAAPVYSQTTPNRNVSSDSPIPHDTTNPSLMIDTRYSVVPSSPAPGKLTGVPQTPANHTSVQSVPDNSLEAMELRRANLELERRFRREDEIEKGVERVLLAILEQANGTAATNAATSKSTSFPPGEYRNDATIEKNENKDWIDSAISSLLESEPSFSPSGMKMRLPRIPSDVDDPKDGAEDDVTATTKNGEDAESEQGDSSSPHSTNVTDKNQEESSACVDERTAAMSNSTQVDRKMIFEEDVSDIALDTKKNVSSTSYTGQLDDIEEIEVESEAVEHRSSSPSTNDDELELEEHELNGKVLGPLSQKMGGTTGVVLHADEDQKEEEFVKEKCIPSMSDDNVEICKEESSTLPSATIFETISSAVKKGPTEILAALSREGSIATPYSGDKSGYSDASEEEMYTDTKTIVKELYRHLLPCDDLSIGKRSLSNWFTQKLNGTPNSPQPEHDWDDEDLDEPGYITHTFTRAQLQHIESEYDNMIQEFEERKNQNDIDDDLIDAESMLNEKEMKVVCKKGRQSKGRSTPEKSLSKRNRSNSKGTRSPKREADSESSRRKQKKPDPLATNPCFPAAKPAGSGTEGELEIYHLPIIYKAHQTGFEPTKDLVLQPDTVFAGKYYVQSELGSAAFSTAYRCVDLNSGKEGDDGEMYYDEVCLKVIKNTKDFFDQSLDEIKILELLRQTGQCNEHNILEMKLFFYHKEHLIIVTELLRQNLFEFGKYVMENDEPRYFTRPRLCYIARQCLIALSFIHKLGLVHSDIKPENILLASYSRARVKVIDFGSSCYLSDRQSSYIQSRSYRAPEVVLGLPYDGKIDVWSLGCVIAEMYTGQVTFQNDSVVTMLSRIEAICGKFPRHMLENGRQSGSFFTPSGLLYEKVVSDDESEVRPSSTFGEENESNSQHEVLFNVFQPKMTTMAGRLGFDPYLMGRKRRTDDDVDRALFTDFVTKLLTIDPDHRLSADEALQHPWILSGMQLTEEDLKYPPE